MVIGGSIQKNLSAGYCFMDFMVSGENIYLYRPLKSFFQQKIEYFGCSGKDRIENNQELNIQ